MKLLQEFYVVEEILLKELVQQEKDQQQQQQDEQTTTNNINNNDDKENEENNNKTKSQRDDDDDDEEKRGEEATSTTKTKLLVTKTTTTTTTSVVETYYGRWRELACTSHIDELDEYINRADCFFSYSTTSTTTITSTTINNNNNNEPQQQPSLPPIDDNSSSTNNNNLQQPISSTTSEHNLPDNINTTTTINNNNTEDDTGIASASRPSQEETQAIENNQVKQQQIGSIVCVSMSSESKQIKTQIDEQEEIIKMSEKPNETSSKTQQQQSYLGEPGEFIKCIEKLISSTQIVDKHLDNIQKPHKEFCEFEKQEIKLNAIKQTLESLAVALKTSLLHKQSIVERSDKETARQIGKLIAQLTKQHQNVVDKYREKKATYLRNYDKWSVFSKDVETICAWLEHTLGKVDELRSAASLDNIDNLDKIKEIIKV